MKYEIKPGLQRILKKLKKKDRVKYKRILKKIKEITDSNPDRYKNLRYDLKEYKRVHIGSYVLIFKYDKEENILRFFDFDHHDNIYER